MNGKYTIKEMMEIADGYTRELKLEDIDANIVRKMIIAVELFVPNDVRLEIFPEVNE